MNVSKIFKTLIIVVVCIILGAFTLNLVLPNVVAGVCNAVEDGIKSGTGITFDINGDGGRTSGTTDDDGSATGGAGVTGWDGGSDED